MKKWILICSLLLLSFGANAQQDAVYSQYIFNQFAINPAYAGARNSMSAVMLHRTRWVGIQGAPTTSTFSIHSNVNNSDFAWGANFAADRLGPTRNVSLALTGAYHVKMRKGKLAFGLRAGVFNSALNANVLEFRDPTDPQIPLASQSAILPTIDFGVYYYTRKFYAGLSLNHMGARKFNFSGIPDASFYLRTHNTLGFGYAFEISENILLKPSVLLKQSDGFDGNLDINLNALFYERIWFGIGVRNRSSINFLFEVNMTDYLRAGYSYDYFVNGLNNASNGAHELFVGFDFSKKKEKVVSPRYL